MFTLVFCALPKANLGVPAGTIKATVLIETLPAAFEMDEILYELRQHSAGLNCGRWDYIFSFIKTMRADPTYIMPDRCALSTLDTVPMWLCQHVEFIAVLERSQSLGKHFPRMVLLWEYCFAEHAVSSQC